MLQTEKNSMKETYAKIFLLLLKILFCTVKYVSYVHVKYFTVPWKGKTETLYLLNPVRVSKPFCLNNVEVSNWS